MDKEWYVRVAKISAWLAEQRKTMTNEQWQKSYRSWAHGGDAWNQYGIGGTDITTALVWYQHHYKPGSREWRPAIIMRAVTAEATK